MNNRDLLNLSLSGLLWSEISIIIGNLMLGLLGGVLPVAPVILIVFGMFGMLIYGCWSIICFIAELPAIMSELFGMVKHNDVLDGNSNLSGGCP